jgi:Sigma-70, region 4
VAPSRSATSAERIPADDVRAIREVYPGEWLPEPLVDDEAVRPAETADSLSLAFLHLLEKLSPVERAAFLLREVIDCPYAEVARIAGKSADEVARRFLASWEDGDTGALIELLPMRPSTETAAGSVRSVLNRDKLTHVPGR